MNASPLVVLEFGTSGIRGILGMDISLEEVLQLSFAASSAFKGPHAIAQDGRRDSGVLSQALTLGLAWSGCEVMDFGLMPTPVLAFSTRNHKLSLGFMVTASHNPPEYVGVKLFTRAGMQLPKSLEGRLESLARYARAEFKGPGRVTRYEDGLREYREAVLSKVPEASRRMRVLVDCGNGVGALMTPLLLEDLGHRVITLNGNVSWRFTSRSPEPTAEALEPASKAVAELGMDLGIAHDGDADRVVLIDENGRVLPDYVLSSILLSIILDRRGTPGPVVLSVNTSSSVEEVAMRGGCRVVRARLGKTFEELERVKGIFATEPSKVIDAEWGLWDDGIYAAVSLIQKLSSEGLHLKDLVKKVPKSNYHQFSLHCDDKDSNQLRGIALGMDYGKKVSKVEELDGIKLKFKDGSWILFRISGTEPKVRVYCEAKEESEAKRLMGLGLTVLRALTSRKSP